MTSNSVKRVGPKYRVTSITSDGKHTNRTYLRSRNDRLHTGLQLAHACAGRVLGKFASVTHVTIDLQDDCGEWHQVEVVSR